jgi:tRNA threonylcarbamoyladenosine biosynthesis protein TsaB
MVQDMLKNAELTVDQCDAVAVANGPGSFTGIRIGVAAAKGLAFAAQKPAVGVSTLEAMALGCAGMEGLIVCAMDARRQQVYNALFRAQGGALARLTPDRPIALSDLAREVKSFEMRKIIVGDGAQLCYTYLLNDEIPCTLAPPHLRMQNAVAVALAAEDALRRGRGVSAQELSPVYLRPGQADRLRAQQIEKEKSI